MPQGRPEIHVWKEETLRPCPFQHKEREKQNLERIQGQGDGGLRHEERRIRGWNGQKSLSRYCQRYYHIVEPEEA